jgi:hypothetical protein
MAGEDKDCTLAKLGSFLSIKELKKCAHLQVIPCIQFDPQTNVIKAGFPGVHLTKPIRIKQGSLAKLF